VEQGESPFLPPPSYRAIIMRYQSEKMIESNKLPCKVLPFVAPPSAIEGKLEKWFRGVIQSNYDLVTTLERLRDSYERKAKKPLTEADRAVLMAVQVTLQNAKNARVL
jgi:hypothetical protein